MSTHEWNQVADERDAVLRDLDAALAENERLRGELVTVRADAVSALLAQGEAAREIEAERDALRAENKQLRAALDRVRALLDDWGSDDTQIKLVTLPARIGVALDAAAVPTKQKRCAACGGPRRECSHIHPAASPTEPTGEQQ